MAIFHSYVKLPEGRIFGVIFGKGMVNVPYMEHVCVHTIPLVETIFDSKESVSKCTCGSVLSNYPENMCIRMRGPKNMFELS